jgi:hypothetical protein
MRLIKIANSSPKNYFGYPAVENGRNILDATGAGRIFCNTRAFYNRIMAMIPCYQGSSKEHWM